MANSLPMTLRVYQKLSSAVVPLAPALISRRLKQGKEDPERIGERRGMSQGIRPHGPLVWIHGASVGEVLAAAALTKFAPLAIVPLFASLRSRRATFIGFGVSALLLLSMLALDSDGISLFWHRTIDYQLGRVTPMAIWTLGLYHPGWYDLRLAQHIFQIAAGLGIVALAFFPRRRRKDAAAVAALSAAVILVAQMAASYWFYPYICWWLPVVMIAVLVPREAPEPEPIPEPFAAEPIPVA